jgi:actin-related protein
MQTMLWHLYRFKTFSERMVVSNIKEQLSYVALDFEQELHKAATTTKCNARYILPDQHAILIGSERFRCPEELFTPSPHVGDHRGVGRILFDSIRSCNADVAKVLCANIVLSGGTTMIPGFAERIEKEIRSLAPQETAIHVVANPRRMYAAWIGGSVLVSRDCFPEMLITGGEYVDVGPEIVHRRCD